ncbi:MAG TPA: hypothetical protein VGY77_04365, partial [Gemmataceae bacterium]|nr:hypothetical protein [Gemmataceae bacterium]
RTPFLIEARRIARDQNIDLGLLFTLSRQSFTDLVMTFPLRTEDGRWNTDFWLQTSFPLFLRNVLFHLGNLNESPTEESVQPGMVKKIRPEEDIKRLSVLGPQGKEQTVSHEDRELRTDFTFGGTEQVGVYKIKWNGKIQGSFAVNLLDAEESNIEPRSSFQIGSDSIVAGRERGQPRDLWKWFVLAALIVLVLEWYIYNRRIYV